MTITTRICAVGSLLGGQLLWVLPDDGGCSGPTLQWVWLEPIARVVGVHGWFQEHGPLGFVVPLVPMGLAVVAVTTMGLGLRALQEARELQASPQGALVVLGIGAWTAFIACWAGFWWLTL